MSGESADTVTTPAAPAITPPVGSVVTSPATAAPKIEIPVADAPPVPATTPMPPPKTGKTEAVEYSPTGDAGLDFALGFVGKLGYGPDHAAMKAAENGDFSLLRAELATNSDAAGWEQIVTLAENAQKGNAEKAKVAQEAVSGALLEAVGGGDSWRAIQEWTRQQVSPEEATEINGMLKTPLGARMVGQYLKGLFDLHGTGNVATPAPIAAAAPASGSATVANGPLSRREFAAEAEKIATKYSRTGKNYMESPEYHAIVARRQASQE